MIELMLSTRSQHITEKWAWPLRLVMLLVFSLSLLTRAHAQTLTIKRMIPINLQGGGDSVSGIHIETPLFTYLPKNAVSANGRFVVGRSFLPGSTVASRGMFWTDREKIDLGCLAPEYCERVEAVSMNSKRNVVGHSYSAGSNPQALPFFYRFTTAELLPLRLDIKDPPFPFAPIEGHVFEITEDGRMYGHVKGIATVSQQSIEVDLVVFWRHEEARPEISPTLGVPEGITRAGRVYANLPGGKLELWKIPSAAPTLYTKPPTYGGFDVKAMNDKLVAVGESVESTPTGTQIRYGMWDMLNGTVTDLGVTELEGVTLRQINEQNMVLANAAGAECLLWLNGNMRHLGHLIKNQASSKYNWHWVDCRNISDEHPDNTVVITGTALLSNQGSTVQKKRAFTMTLGF